MTALERRDKPEYREEDLLIQGYSGVMAAMGRPWKGCIQQCFASLILRDPP